MKNSLFAFLLFFTVSIFAQKENLKYVKITQKICLKKTGYQLVLKDVVSDSRCPEGVVCVWAGEVSVVVSVYKDSKIVADKTIVFSEKNKEENKQWFAQYLPEKQKSIKNFSVLPYPKQNTEIHKKDYYVKIVFIKSV